MPDDPTTMSTALDVALRLTLAMLLGLLLGLEREARGKQAGLKTMALISMGSAGFMIVGLQIAQANDSMGDATRLVAGLAAAIGFLGAGVIMREKDPAGEPTESVRGMTTAAMIFVAAAIGGACGSGLWWTAVVLTIGTTIVLTVVRFAENIVRDEVSRNNGGSRSADD